MANAGALGAGIVGLLVLEVLSPDNREVIAGWIALVIALARTVAVYGFGFDFLFYGPEAAARDSGSSSPRADGGPKRA